MRKSIFVGTLSCCFGLFCFISFGVVTLTAYGQDSTSAAPPAPAQTTAPAQEAPAALPSDPKELMLLAAKSNGLTGDDVKPWHVKASYQLLDDQGKVEDQGIYEEFWVSGKKYKRTFTGKTFAQTEYGTSKGYFFSGDLNAQFRQGYKIRNEFFNPMPNLEMIEKFNFTLQKHEAGGIKYVCLNYQVANGNLLDVGWCLAADKPILRIDFLPQEGRVIHNRILRFQNRFIAGDLLFVQQEKATLTAHIDMIEALNHIDEAVFLPPADATLELPKKISISGGVMAGMALHKVAPDYPPIAKAAGVQGTVVLQATIGKDGRIEHLHVISGPPMLQQAALDAVKRWTYKPYTLAGEPVEVDTTVNVIFALGGNWGKQF
jgi:TonB family protein